MNIKLVSKGLPLGNRKRASHIGENMLRIYTLAIQKGELKELFKRDEINESIYKKNMLILDQKKN
ncbi:MAG: hypothetical protein H0A75_07510 [Candidatus Methanofishera endochildressiae]|uniref:Uncharacterized protein n=1 Tax=Candidatus Methanofishera endochildressiae TaxID=2738884 RepID=A0A7Z0MPE3_9GAMM|nr:hypothetical protein [Candidatus Methanofishera endochildressiae]